MAFPNLCRLERMRIPLVFVAALGLPLAALAQPAADSGKPTAPTGLSVTAPNKFADLSGITVTGRCTGFPPDADAQHDPREWDPPAAKAQRTEPSAGTLEFLEKTVAMFARQTTFDPATAPKMDIGLARGTEEQFGRLSSWVKCRGAPKSIRFLHVSARGYDDYEVDFADGAIEWEVQPPRADQAVYEADFRYFYPQPATKQFEEFLDSLEREKPDYSDLTPALASGLQESWPVLHQKFTEWGKRKSIYFVRQGVDGSYVYSLFFQKHRVAWDVAFTDGNKITALAYTEAPN